MNIPLFSNQHPFATQIAVHQTELINFPKSMSQIVKSKILQFLLSCIADLNTLLGFYIIGMISIMEFNFRSLTIINILFLFFISI